jgi:hypothetical protein
MNKLVIKIYKIIRKNKKINLPILSENRSNPSAQAFIKVIRFYSASNRSSYRPVSLFLGAH